MNGDAHHTITVFVTLLLIASGVAILTKRIRIPYTLALVVVGLTISPMHFLPPVHMSPELILLVFLPALLFEAAWNLKLDEFRANMGPILLLASLGVVLSVGIIGTILHLMLDISWPTALLFGSVISATDPVSVLALFKKLHAPERLTVLIEGESLLNDGTAVVVFRILLGFITGTTALGSNGAIVWHSLKAFGFVVLGGLAVGLLIGFLVSKLTSYFDDHLLEITLTTIAAYGSFLLAEFFEVSPVIAVLVAGVIIGNYGWRVGMSDVTRVAVDAFWEYAAFVVNSLVFLLIGLEIPLSLLAEYIVAIGGSVLALVIARLVVIYGLVGFGNLFSDPIPWRWQHIMFWGGLRGSLSIALVLSLPLSFPDRKLLTALTFGAVVFSLLGQGLTISPLIRWLRVSKS